MADGLSRELRQGDSRSITVPEFVTGVGAGGIRRGSFVGVTNAGGDIAIVFATPFAAGVVPIVVVSLGDDVGATSVITLAANVNNANFSCRVRVASGAAHASLPVRINYIAVAP